MKTIGIIAEFNPFHNGHAYLIKKAKEFTGADRVIVIMSGNFVQRGCPAIINKYDRTLHALENGCDCVFELPPVFSTASAETFAKASVYFLHNLNCINYLCFGCEDNNLDLLKSIASILHDEPDEYKASLALHLKSGNNYPVARQKALTDYLMSIDVNSNIADVLSKPNNILAIEYIKALIELNSPIVPVGINREGSGYNSTSLNSSFASASGIREAFTNDVALDSIANHLSKAAFSSLLNEKEQNSLITLNDFSSMLGLTLLNNDSFDKFNDINTDLSNRILNERANFYSFESFIEKLQSKNYTYSRISRTLMHIMLNIHSEDIDFYKRIGYLPVGRLLGFKKSSSDILKHIKENSNVDIISKLSIYYKTSTGDIKKLLDNWLYCDSIYRLVYMNKSGKYMPTEFNYKIIVV